MTEDDLRVKVDSLTKHVQVVRSIKPAMERMIAYCQFIMSASPKEAGDNPKVTTAKDLRNIPKLKRNLRNLNDKLSKLDLKHAAFEQYAEEQLQVATAAASQRDALGALSAVNDTYQRMAELNETFVKHSSIVEGLVSKAKSNNKTVEMMEAIGFKDELAIWQQATETLMAKLMAVNVAARLSA